MFEKMTIFFLQRKPFHLHRYLNLTYAFIQYLKMFLMIDSSLTSSLMPIINPLVPGVH